MAIARKKIFRNIALLMVLNFAWSWLLLAPVACLWNHGAPTAEHGHAETGRVKDHTFKFSGFGVEKGSHCPYYQSRYSRLMRTVVISKFYAEKQPLETLAQYVAETGTVLQPVSDLNARHSADSTADPGKLYLQNQSFLC